MNKFTPWKIENGTLQLLPWPDHPPGDVLVEVDVFEAWEGGIYDRCGNQLGVGCELGMGRVMRMDDLLMEFFRHIDANPQTTFHLRTLHPERVREVWPAWADHACHTGDCPHSKQAECDADGSRFHRPNVTLSLGPLATQADADRLVPEMLPLADLCGGLELYSVPTERIDYGRWLNCHCGEPPLEEGEHCIGCVNGPPSRIRVDGDRDDNVRFIEQQAIAAGVAFALNWESEVKA